MESAQFAMDMTQEQEMFMTKKRLETFQFRRTTASSTQMAPPSPTFSFGRPHSRSGSVASTSLTASNSAPSEFSTNSSSSRPSSFTSRSRPSSHHRRRSSVSTRVESAEIMGVALPDLPSSTSDDNINFGDKDSIRRRALLALEGKNDLGSKSGMVEIPELSSQGIPTKSFDPKPQSSVPSFGSLPGKRDSFGKFLGSANSLKDQLHTLMEEEEEEEEDTQSVSDHRRKAAAILINAGAESITSTDKDVNESSPILSGHIAQPVALVPNTAPPPPGRHKPAHLTLRPLTLASSSAVGLPTPCSTPSTRPGLRALALGASSSESSIIPSSSSADQRISSQLSRHSSESSTSSSSDFSRLHTAMGCAPSKSALTPKRQSSISYIRSTKAASPPQMVTGLPTPGPTPILEKRQSLSSSSLPSVGEHERHNASDEIFLRQSHASLLARIRELEQIIKTRSRPTSMHSDELSGPTENSELLHLIAELKGDRDDLNRELSAARKRLEELNEMTNELRNRLAVESREGALRGEKISLLESEKITLQRQVRLKDQELSSISEELEASRLRLSQSLDSLSVARKDTDDARVQLLDVQSQLAVVKGTEAELTKVREELVTERAYREKLISQLEASGLLQTPRLNYGDDQPTGTRSKYTVPIRNNTFEFQSIDSTCTTVETESIRTLAAPFTLKAVEEEPGSLTINFNDDDDALAHYEDEDDSDLAILSPSQTMSSCSDDDTSHSRLHANDAPDPSNGDVPMSSRSLSPSPLSSPCPTPLPLVPSNVPETQHSKRASLSKSWTFPRDRSTSTQRPEEEVDHFFGCLENIDDSPPELRVSDSGSLFRQRLQFTTSQDDDMPPFLLPSTLSEVEHPRLLDVVLEADEPFYNVDEATAFDSNRLNTSSASDQFVPFIFPQRSSDKPVKNTSAPISRSPSDTPRSSKAGNGSSLIPKSVARPLRPSTPDRAYMRPSSSAVATPAVSSSPLTQKLPSPPTFVQARSGKASKSPSPPRRKPAPLANTPTPPFGFESSLSVESSRTSVQSRNGSTFIPKLKSPSTHTHSSYPCMTDSSLPSSFSSSRSSVQATSLGEGPSRTSGVAPYNSFKPLKRTADSDASYSQQPIFQAITNFLPVASLSWMGNKQRVSTEKARGFVSREVQLSKLRNRMRLGQLVTAPTEEMRCCRRCQGDIVVT